MPSEKEVTQGKKKERKEKEKKEKAPKTIAELTALPKGIKVQYIKIADLIPQEIAPRQELKALAKLKRSVKNVGILEPLVVRPHEQEGKFEVVSGNRRLEVLKSLKVETAPCLIQDLDASHTMSHIFVSNTQRQNLAKFDMQYIAENLVEAIGDEETAKLLALTPKALERLVSPPPKTEGEAGEPAPKETSILLDADQTKAFIAGSNTSAVFGKALAQEGDTITIVGVLGKGKVTGVKEVEGGVELSWQVI